jgi:tetratricopeptide (TPR) repeat protein
VRNYSDAIKYINEYLEVAKAKNDKVLEISLLSKLSTSYFFSSSKSKAEEYAAIAKSRFNELGKEDVSCVSCGVASALYQLGECEDAMPILEKGLKAAINEKNELAQSAQLTVIGYCQEKDKKYKDAMATVEKNIELHKAMYRADHHYIQFFERKLKEIKEKANAK